MVRQSGIMAIFAALVCAADMTAAAERVKAAFNAAFYTGDGLYDDGLLTALAAPLFGDLSAWAYEYAAGIVPQEIKVLRESDAGEEATVKVDFSRETGPVKPMHGVGQPPMVDKLGSWSMMHYLKEAKYNVVHFNNGLHSCETPVADYEKSYRAALQLVNRWTQPRPFGAK